MNPLVSILIPAYNAEKYIGATLESALGQTWPHKEIIVVDDGSRDQTLAVARRYETRGVKVITQKNSGAAAARNRAMAECQGEYLQWLDADDLIGRDKIERQMEQALKFPGRRLLYSSPWGRFLYRPEKAKFENTALCADQQPVDWLVRKMGSNLHMQPATWLVSRELSIIAGPWDTRLTLDDDGEYFCRVILASTGIRFVDGARTYYRHTSASSLSAVDLSDKKLESLWLSMQLHVGYLRGLEESPRTHAACLTYLGNWLGYFEATRPDLVAAARRLAATMGGQLELPGVRSKYVLVEKLFGRRSALRAQTLAPQLKARCLRTWDHTLFRLYGAKPV